MIGKLLYVKFSDFVFSKVYDASTQNFERWHHFFLVFPKSAHLKLSFPLLMASKLLKLQEL